MQDATLIVGRTPRLPVETALRLFDSPEPYGELRALMMECPDIRSAILVASPSLAAALEKWLLDERAPSCPAALRGISYVVRMSTRATPYGLFAGVGEIEAGETTTLELGDEWRALVRPDMALVEKVARAVAEGPASGNVRYVANRAVVERAGRLHVTNLRLTNTTVKAGEGIKEQRAVSMRNTQSVQVTRDLAASPVTFATLTATLSDRFAEPRSTVERFIRHLIDAGLLLSEFDVAPLGNPQERLARRLRELDTSTGSAFASLLASAQSLSERSLAATVPDDYRTLGSAFVELSEGSSGTPLHIDLIAPTHGAIGKNVMQEVERAALLLSDAKPAYLTPYAKRFIERYEGTERMVPLLELVDRDLGLGAPEGLEATQDEDPELDRLRVRLACEAAHVRREEIELSAQDVNLLFPHFAKGQGRAGHDFSFHVIARSREAIDRGEFQVVPGTVTTATRGQSMGRFAQALGPGFTQRLRAVVRPSDDVDETVELVYPPYGRLYNVSTRANVRRSELRIGIGEPSDAADVYEPDDLWVGLEADRFFLWSQSRQRRVGIAEGHLLVTTSLASPICRFLSLLTTQDRQNSRRFAWGPAESMRALPRVRFGKVILRERRWKFDTAALGKTPAQSADALRSWRDLWGLPRYIVLEERDNRLVLDLDSELSAELLLDQADTNEPLLTLTEMLPDPEHLWLNADNGRHALELVAALPDNPNAKPPERTTRTAPVLVMDRQRFGPGSPWTYAKFYLNRHAQDGFIAQELAPLVRSICADLPVDRWFFLRYADPGEHVRLRMYSHEASARVREHIVAAAEQWLGGSMIERYLFDTYDPEYERYGGPRELEAVERFWCENSDACATALGGIGHEDAARIAVAAKTFNEFLLGSVAAEGLAIDALTEQARAAIPADDRVVLKDLQRATNGRASSIDAALRCDEPGLRLRNLLHLHANRLGVTRDGEPRISALLRGAALARRSRSLTTSKG